MDKKIKVILDTDTFNEIDDQFALTYMVRSKEFFEVQAIYAAPFWNDKSNGPKDGMEKSYDEILKLLELMGSSELKDVVYKGSDRYLSDEKTPVISDAAKDLVRRANEMPEDEKLCVVAIGAITNVASAILIDTSISKKIKIVWLGGNAYNWTDTKEFNMMQDVAAIRSIWDTDVEFVQLPCMGVVDRLTTTRYELEHFLKGKDAVCNYLCDYSVKVALKESKYRTWSRVIWDISAIAYLKGGLMCSEMLPAPIPTYDHKYEFDDTRRKIECVTWVERDAIFEDLFETIVPKEIN